MVSLAVLADLTRAGEERDDCEEEESGVNVGLQAQKASSRLRQESVSQSQYQGSLEPSGGRQSQLKLGDEGQGRAGQGSRPRHLRHLHSSDEWRWRRIGSVSGQP